MPGSPTTPGRPGTRARAPVRLAFRDQKRVGTRNSTSFAAQWLACALPCRRFAVTLAGANARFGVEVISLCLPRGGLAPPTPCRSPGALRLSPSYYTLVSYRLARAEGRFLPFIHQILRFLTRPRALRGDLIIYPVPGGISEFRDRAASAPCDGRVSRLPTLVRHRAQDYLGTIGRTIG